MTDDRCRRPVTVVIQCLNRNFSSANVAAFQIGPICRAADLHGAVMCPDIQSPILDARNPRRRLGVFCLTDFRLGLTIDAACFEAAVIDARLAPGLLQSGIAVILPGLPQLLKKAILPGGIAASGLRPLHLIPVGALFAETLRPDIPQGEHDMRVRLIHAVAGMGVVQPDIGNHAAPYELIADEGAHQGNSLLGIELAGNGQKCFSKELSILTLLSPFHSIPEPAPVIDPSRRIVGCEDARPDDVLLARIVMGDPGPLIAKSWLDR